MKPSKIIEADFEIDKLTNSIENSITGEVFDTEVTRLYLNESRQIKRSEWGFEWHKEFSDFLKNRKTKSVPKSKKNQRTRIATKPKKTELA